MSETYTLYHATSIENFLSIVESNELIPQSTSMSDWANINNIDYYFNNNEYKFENHLENYIGYTFFATNQFSSQRYGIRASDKSAFNNLYVILTTQLPEDILLPDTNDTIDARAWEDSAKDVGQVKVLGNVKINSDSEIIIVDRSLHIVINTTIVNWKRDLKKELAKQVKYGYYDIDECYDLWSKLDIPFANKA
ncbi:hypothetical protein ACFQZE_07230 [Paenibacillus sp. GCM10027627]|uniref:hypothetical protein n=1 Tax=unclassified Paenibacillus TaxID=185978 RepID=UPI003642BFA6